MLREWPELEHFNHERLDTFHPVFFDTETIGANPKEAHLIELATLAINPKFDGDGRNPVDHMWRFKPPIPIPPEASAVHNIIDSDLIPYSAFDPDRAGRINNVFHGRVLVAHNAPFDWTIYLRHCAEVGSDPPAPICVIDTLPMARILWPAAQNHRLTTCAYLAGIPRDAIIAETAHSALGDCNLLLMVWYRMVKLWVANPKLSPRLSWVLSTIYAPRLLETCTFGKHAGTPYRDLPQDYLEWWIFKRPTPDPESEDFNPDKEFTFAMVYLSRNVNPQSRNGVIAGRICNSAIRMALLRARSLVCGVELKENQGFHTGQGQDEIPF